MAIGPQDYIDELLVKKYSQTQVDNHDAMTSMVDPQKVMSAMNDYSTVSRNMFALSNKLTLACSKLNAMSAKYKQAASFEG